MDDLLAKILFGAFAVLGIIVAIGFSSILIIYFIKMVRYLITNEFTTLI